MVTSLPTTGRKVYETRQKHCKMPLSFKPFAFGSPTWRLGVRTPGTTRKSTGMRREQMNTFAAGAIGDGFMQLSAKSTDPNG
jgi:hypothetical protein